MSRNGKVREPVTPKSVLIPLGAGLVLAAVTFIVQGGFSAADAEAFWRAVCDAMTVPGMLLTCLGLLSVASGQGAFDGLNFSVRKAFSQVLREERRNAMPKTFYDYVTLKQEKQRNKPRTHLYVGLGFLVLAAASLAVYLSVS